MNQRIQELAEQAGYNPAWSTKADREEYLDLNKFAELIVRECALQCVHNEDMALIEKHFGVQE